MSVNPIPHLDEHSASPLQFLQVYHLLLTEKNDMAMVDMAVLYRAIGLFEHYYRFIRIFLLAHALYALFFYGMHACMHQQKA